MGSMVPAVGIEAVFEGEQKDGKTYTFSCPVLFWYDVPAFNAPVGMYLDDNGMLTSAESRSNLMRYATSEEAPIVAAVPADDLYAVFRDTDQTLHRTPIITLALRADGTLSAKEFLSDGDSFGSPEDSSNFVAYWRESWGDEPIAWSEEVEDTRDEDSFDLNSYIAERTPKQGTFFEASGGSPPGDKR